MTYKKLPQDVKTGDTLVLDDGRIVLQVDAVDGPRIDCTVEVGGELSDNKGINLERAVDLTAEVLTEKDKRRYQNCRADRCDYLAVSFPAQRRRYDIRRVKLLEAEG